MEKTAQFFVMSIANCWSTRWPNGTIFTICLFNIAMENDNFQKGKSSIHGQFSIAMLVQMVPLIDGHQNMMNIC